jgi:hypothetical protein
VTSRGTVAKYLSEEGRLSFFTFPFEGGIVHNGSTLNTAHLAEFVFLLRDTIGDHATVGADA